MRFALILLITMLPHRRLASGRSAFSGTPCLCKHCLWSQDQAISPTQLSLSCKFRVLLAGQELAEPTNVISHSTEASATPNHTTTTYNSLSDELAAYQHTRFTVQLKHGYDLLDIILTMFDWKEQDTDQLWIRPVEHVDREQYDIKTSAGIEAALMTFIRKVCWNHAFSQDSSTWPKEHSLCSCLHALFSRSFHVALAGRYCVHTV